MPPTPRPKKACVARQTSPARPSSPAARLNSAIRGVGRPGCHLQAEKPAPGAPFCPVHRVHTFSSNEEMAWLRQARSSPKSAARSHPDSISRAGDAGRQFFFRKNVSHVRLLSKAPSASSVDRCAKAFFGARRRKSLAADTLGLHLLQTLEIPRNRQRFLWKSLEKKGSDLEMLGKTLGREARPGRRLCRGVSCAS